MFQLEQIIDTTLRIYLFGAFKCMILLQSDITYSLKKCKFVCLGEKIDNIGTVKVRKRQQTKTFSVDFFQNTSSAFHTHVNQKSSYQTENKVFLPKYPRYFLNRPVHTSVIIGHHLYLITFRPYIFIIWLRYCPYGVKH